MNSSLRNPRFTFCCGTNGAIKLPPIKDPPADLKRLFGEGEERSDHDNHITNQFLKNIRKFNNIFSFTSIGCNIDRSFMRGSRGPNTFRIHGKLYHLMGTILPDAGALCQFAQLYIHDTDHDETLNTRLKALRNNGNHATNSTNDRALSEMHHRREEEIVNRITDTMNAYNVYVPQFKYAGDKFRSGNAPELRMKIVDKRTADPAHDPRVYNTPTAGEVAAIIPEDGTNGPADRDVIVELRNRDDRTAYTRVSATHPSYFPLSYPLLFPYGEDGFRLGIPRRDQELREYRPRRQRVVVEEEGEENGNNVQYYENEGNGISQMEYFCYRLQYRENDGSKYMFLAKRLFQQLAVDMYAAMELNRLNWFRINQSKLRAEVYKGNNSNDCLTIFL